MSDYPTYPFSVYKKLFMLAFELVSSPLVERQKGGENLGILFSI